MIPKNTKLRRTEAALLLGALGLVIILYWASSKSSNETIDSSSQSRENTNTPLAPLPAAANSTPHPTTPLEALLNRPPRGLSPQQAMPNPQIDSESPAQAAGASSEMAAPGAPALLDRSQPQNLGNGNGNGKAPPGVPVTKKMLDPSFEALRNDNP